MLKVQQQRQMARSSGATALRRPSAAPVRRRALARPARHACVRPMMFQPDKQSAKAGGETGDVPRNQLEALRRMTTVVADSGEVALVKKYRPQDCTTNPSLVLKAVQNLEYEHLLANAMSERGKLGAAASGRPFAGAADVLAVNLGVEMLKIVPGRVSTEVDAHLSHDTAATIDQALRLTELYAARGVEPSRVYIKIASTWEGIEACRKLEAQGIATNMTLLFSFAQAAACADAGATLISPFVGRIMDWYKAKEGRDFAPHEDPGVLSVKRIYQYYKTHAYPTIVMAASFRNAGEVRELAGIDNVTVSPSLLAELEGCTDVLPRKLSPDGPPSSEHKLQQMTRQQFDILHSADAMAVEKLGQGVESFAADQRKLEELLAKLA